VCSNVSGTMNSSRSMTQNIVLDKEWQVGHDLLRFTRYLFDPVESYDPVFHVHICGLHIGDRIPVGLVERNSRQDSFPPLAIIASQSGIMRYTFRGTI
jgi:hypothetical protein